MPRVEDLTAAFYAWETRGRGWQSFAERVALEPTFEPFRGHGAARPAADDGRRHTWLSALVEGLGRRTPAGEPAPLIDEIPEAEPRPFDGADELEEYLVALPAEARAGRAAFLGWLEALGSVGDRGAFEVAGSTGRVDVRLALAPGEAPHVLGQLQAALPEVLVVPAADGLERRWAEVDGARFTALEFGLACEFMVPLAVPKPGEEPLRALVAALAELGEGELGLVQALFEPCHEPWAESVLHAVTGTDGRPFFADAPEVTSLAKEKVATPFFAVALRAAALADEDDRAGEILRRLAAALASFGNPLRNEFLPLAPADLSTLEEDLLLRTTHRSGMLLSADELAALLHLPGAGVRVPQLWRGEGRSRAAPAEALGAGTAPGVNPHAGRRAEVRLSPEVRCKHVHVIGAPGTGKSTLLLRMIREDIEAGHGVGVLDPHGDLVDEIASRLPAERLGSCALFDPADEEASVGWNVLGADSEAERDLLASDLVSVFRRLSTSWGDQMTAVLGNAIQVFLLSPRGGTLLDLRRFLVDAAFRREILATVSDPYAASFWETEFPRLIGRRPEAPILTRLDMFLRSRLVRRVVTAEETRLDFRKLTDEGGIFLGKLASGAIGEENAALLGSLLVSKFHQVTLARTTQAAASRRPFFLFIDEFHAVATASMASLFSGARKYALGLTVAHQDLSQLHHSMPELERSILGNAYTRICFRVGEEDGRQLSKGLSFFSAEDLMSLGRGEAICRVGGRDGDFNLETSPLDPIPEEEASRRREEVRALTRERYPASQEAHEAPPAPALPEPLRTEEPQHNLGAPPRPAAAGDLKQRLSREERRERAAEPAIDKAVLDYVALVARSPFLTVRERNAALGLSAWRGDRIKSAILDAALAEEVAVHPGGRGERFKLLDLTPAGRDLLARYGIAIARGHGRGGIAHQWWVRRVAEWLRQQGVETTVEDETKGVRVDIRLHLNGNDIAVEVETSDGHIVENLRKDRAAGYVRTVCLIDSPGALTKLRAKLDVVRDDVVVGDLRDFEAVLTAVLSSLRPPNQNAERKRRRRRREAPSAPPAAVAAPPLFEPTACSTPHAADYLGLSPATLETLRVRGGGPPFVKLGRRVIYQRTDLDAWLSARKRRSTSDPG